MLQSLIEFLKKLARADFGVDLLALIAIITALWLHEYITAILLIIMLVSGRALEAFAVKKASSALLALADRMPRVAHRKQNAHIIDIELNDVQIGDLIVIYPHESAPVDGTVIEGHSNMDESYLTGEPYSVSKAPGTTVLSGAINGDAILVIRADKLPADSRYAKIMLVMQEAEQKRPNMRRLADQIGMFFSPFALGFAGLVWFLSGDPDRFLAVLVVATPCPLLIAIPITLISAISLAAKRGIIIKDPMILERLPTCTTAIFDKTGTLTYGKPALTDIVTAPHLTQDEALQYAAGLERYSKHPLANALLNAAQNAKLFLLEATAISEIPGQGLTGTIHQKILKMTSRKYLAVNYPDLLSLLPAEQPGLECILLADNQYAATFRFRDIPRHDSADFIQHLAPRHAFTKTMLVSGDRSSEVDYLAALIGINEAYASQSPEQKLALVRAETQKAPTLFMGDGINDAPALTAATVGLAFGQNTSVTAAAAGAVIMENTLEKVDELLHISISMRRIALQSAIGGMVVSIIAMFFAAFGFIPPVAGALLQEAIDVAAIANALRLVFKKKWDSDYLSPKISAK